MKVPTTEGRTPFTIRSFITYMHDNQLSCSNSLQEILQFVRENFPDGDCTVEQLIECLVDEETLPTLAAPRTPLERAKALGWSIIK